MFQAFLVFYGVVIGGGGGGLSNIIKGSAVICLIDTPNIIPSVSVLFYEVWSSVVVPLASTAINQLSLVIT